VNRFRILINYCDGCRAALLIFKRLRTRFKYPRNLIPGFPLLLIDQLETNQPVQPHTPHKLRAREVLDASNKEDCI